MVFVNRFYAPDTSATSQILTQLAVHLAGRGWEVKVVTSRLRYQAAGRLPATDLIDGVGVTRVASTRLGDKGLAGRALDYACFYATALVALLSDLRRGDIVVAKTDPPLISLVAAVATAMRGARLVNWLQDLYPEVAAAHGVGLATGPSGALLRGLRNASLRAAVANVAVSHDMAGVVEAAVGPARVEVIHNWCDDQAIRPVAPSDNLLRRAWDLEHRFVVGYSGNLGRAHDWKTIVEAAARLRGRQDLVFLMIGAGAGLERLRAEVARQGLQRLFRFEPHQPAQSLGWSMSVPDLHLVSLLPAFRGLMFPSKVFGIAAAGRGMIGIVDAPCDLAEILVEHGCGEITPVADGDALARAVERLAADRAGTESLGARARAMLDRRFSRTEALARWEGVLRRAVDFTAPREHQVHASLQRDVAPANSES